MDANNAGYTSGTELSTIIAKLIFSFRPCQRRSDFIISAPTPEALGKVPCGSRMLPGRPCQTQKMPLLLPHTYAQRFWLISRCHQHRASRIIAAYWFIQYPGNELMPLRHIYTQQCRSTLEKKDGCYSMRWPLADGCSTTCGTALHAIFF